MEIYDVVTKLVGPVLPVGKTETDEIRFDNLKELCALMDRLLDDIGEVAERYGRPEFSINRAAEYAKKFIMSMGIKE